MYFFTNCFDVKNQNYADLGVLLWVGADGPDADETQEVGGLPEAGPRKHCAPLLVPQVGVLVHRPGGELNHVVVLHGKERNREPA